MTSVPQTAYRDHMDTVLAGVGVLRPCDDREERGLVPDLLLDPQQVARSLVHRALSQPHLDVPERLVVLTELDVSESGYVSAGVLGNCRIKLSFDNIIGGVGTISLVELGTSQAPTGIV